MRHARKVFDWIRRPHGPVLIAVYLVALGTCIGAILMTAYEPKDYQLSLLIYIIYAIAAIALGYSIYTLIILGPTIKRSAKDWLGQFSIIDKILKQYGFRTLIFAAGSLIINIGNALLNGIAGIIYMSVWYGALGIYYLVLSTMRGGMLFYHHRRKKYSKTDDTYQLLVHDVKSYRTCGLVLTVLPLILSFIIREMVHSDRYFPHPGMMVYVVAIYTFYKVVMSIYNFFKARRSDEMTIRAVRYVNLADALVAILALQTTMFHEFSPERSFGYANAIVGGIIFAATAAIGFYMIISGTIKIKNLQEKKDRL